MAVVGALSKQRSTVRISLFVHQSCNCQPQYFGIKLFFSFFFKIISLISVRTKKIKSKKTNLYLTTMTNKVKQNAYQKISAIELHLKPNHYVALLDFRNAQIRLEA